MSDDIVGPDIPEGQIVVAGLESWKTPFDSPEFEEWMASRAGDVS